MSVVRLLMVWLTPRPPLPSNTNPLVNVVPGSKPLKSVALKSLPSAYCALRVDSVAPMRPRSVALLTSM